MDNASDLFNPFVGLRAFEEDEDYLFFGRTAEINDLLKKFASSRFLAVIGSSGSGKSSLVKSGLLPAIHSGFLSSGHNWHVALMRPGNQPISNLAEALSKAGVLYDSDKTPDGIPYQPIVESSLRRSGNGLMQVYKQSPIFNKENAKGNKPQTENLLIIVDQFEELFRFSSYEKEKGQGDSQSLNFINLLLTAAEDSQKKDDQQDGYQERLPIYVLLTMRSDFLGDCSQFRGLPEAINKGQYLVPRMTRDEVKEAITGPVAIGGAEITQSLVTRLLNDVGNDIDQLPILQHAMMRTWDEWAKRNQPHDPINIEDYSKTGGMTDALSKHANEIYDELKTDEHKKYCELMFKALTDKAADVRGTRRPRSVTDLNILTNASPAAIIEIVELFRKPGRTFLMPPPSVAINNDSIIDISHESLMRVWDKLKSWTEEEAINADIFKRLAEDAKREANGIGSLWINPELEIGLKWKEKFNNNDERLSTWAKSFRVDLQQALNFLNKSEAAAIALKEEKEKLKREEKERELAEAKRIQDEKDQKARIKRRQMIVGMAVCLLFAIGAFVAFIKVRVERNRANDATTLALEAKHSDSLAKVDALLQKSIAESAKIAADRNAAIAIRAQIRDSLSNIEAVRSAHIADQKTKEAKIAEAAAKKSRDESLLKSKSIALNEYLRLIRTGPTDKSKILSDQFDYKVVAYADYINLLDTPLHANSWNNELYEKLYYSLIANNAEYAACNATIEKYNPNFELGNNVVVSISKGYLLETKNTLADSVIGTKTVSNMNNIKAIHVNKKDQLLICSTSDNMITVLSYDANYKLTIKNKIPMGALVTALDYDPGKNVIFFGLTSGEIGYILYGNDKKNQPVYDNLPDISQCDKKMLNQEISAVDYFNYKDTTYFLATSNNGKAIVYKLDNNQFKPNEKLSGIELPLNKGEIVAARFDESKKLILLNIKNKGSDFVYEWNPFVTEIQKQLKNLLPDKSKISKINEACKFY